MVSSTTEGKQSIRLSILGYPLGLWVVMAVVAVLNGVFRESILIPQVGSSIGHVVSTALLIGAILILSSVYFGRSSIDYTQTELLAIGVGWVILTVGFEFLIGYLEGIPVSETLAQYDLFAGHVWIFVPLTLLVAPFLFGSYLPSRRKA
jgi:hypothetical protein